MTRIGQSVKVRAMTTLPKSRPRPGTSICVLKAPPGQRHVLEDSFTAYHSSTFSIESYSYERGCEDWRGQFDQTPINYIHTFQIKTQLWFVLDWWHQQILNGQSTTFCQTTDSQSPDAHIRWKEIVKFRDPEFMWRFDGAEHWLLLGRVLCRYENAILSKYH